METITPTHTYHVAMTIAGSDSSGGAGIQADLKTFSALGVYGCSTITAVTAQNSRGVDHIEVLTPRSIAAQMEAVITDLHPQAIKSGMLFDSNTMEVVAEKVAQHHLTPYIIDPVMISTSGVALMSEEAFATLTRRLLPLATLITPNLHEAGYLTESTIRTRSEMEQAATILLDRFPLQGILLKGGHLEGEEQAYDLLRYGEESLWISGKTIASRNTHGTGCTLSAAITAYMALGHDLVASVQQAKQYLIHAIAAGAHIYAGAGHGAVNHLYNPVPLHQKNLEI